MIIWSEIRVPIRIGNLKMSHKDHPSCVRTNYLVLCVHYIGVFFCSSTVDVLAFTTLFCKFRLFIWRDKGCIIINEFKIGRYPIENVATFERVAK